MTMKVELKLCLMEMFSPQKITMTSLFVQLILLELKRRYQWEEVIGRISIIRLLPSHSCPKILSLRFSDVLELSREIESIGSVCMCVYKYTKKRFIMRYQLMQLWSLANLKICRVSQQAGDSGEPTVQCQSKGQQI